MLFRSGGGGCRCLEVCVRGVREGVCEGVCSWGGPGGGRRESLHAVVRNPCGLAAAKASGILVVGHRGHHLEDIERERGHTHVCYGINTRV